MRSPPRPEEEPGARGGTTDLLFARIAGLPASVLSGLDGHGCRGALAAFAAVERELTVARRELADRLHGAVSDASREERRFLLAVRRDLFNGRRLDRHRSRPMWARLYGSWGPGADRVARLEDRSGSLGRALEAECAREVDRETRHLASLALSPYLARGLALSSPSLLRSLPRLTAEAGPREDRKRRRTRISLLRYVSRAAAKLSPFSTLTRVALARPAVTGPPVALVGRPGEWAESSLVRLRRYLPAQVAAVLLDSRALRDRLPVELNPSLTEVGTDRYRLLRPGGWHRSGRASPARRVGGLPAEVPVSGAVIRWLRERLEEPKRLADLDRELARFLGADGDEERARELVDRLRRLGVLVPAPPWSCQDPRLEERLLAWIRSAPASPELVPVAQALDDLVELERGFSAAPDPLAVLRELEERLDAAWGAAGRAAGLDRPVPLHRSKENEVYEDVLLLGPREEAPVDVSLRHLGELLDLADPWCRLADLFNPRHELLLTFAALARRRWPERSETGALDLFEEVLPHWRELRRALGDRRSPGPGQAPLFDPLELPEVAELQGLRRDVWSALGELVRWENGEGRLAASDLCRLVGRIPAHHAPPMGPCLFLQPADPAGDRWVLNRIFEGSGRYGSRFLPLLPQALRRRAADDLVARSVLRRRDRPWELVDLVSSRGDTLNVHCVQTRRVVALPGEPSPVPRERRLDPADLRVRWSAPLPELFDGQGTALLPVHLGAAGVLFSGPLPAFLSAFGPGEIRPLPVPRDSREERGVRRLGRVSLGRLVLARTRWIVPAATLRDLVDRPPGEALAALERWRRAHDVPALVFAIEKVRFGDGSEVYKPQYLDLRSPSFATLLATLVRGSDEPLTLEEMLPDPGAYPRDAAGEGWAVEIQVDELSAPSVRFGPRATNGRLPPP